MGISRVEAYDPITMGLLSSDITELDFGDITRGNYCSQAIVIKPILSGTITQLFMFLEDNGGYNNSEFGYFVDSEEFTGIQPGGSQLSDHFVPDPGVSDLTTSDYGAELDPTGIDFVWLDAYISTADSVGLGSLNYRFVFEYN